jgi:competence ComEA-like helix-hairpin-helix protein
VETIPAEAEPVEEQPEEVAVPEWLEGMSLEAMAQEGEAAPEEIEAETPIPPEVEAPVEGIPSQLASEEAALAWLEGLAAKQGASEEELITKPEERPVETPDWIQELAAEPGEAVPDAVADEAVTEEVPAPEEVPQKVEGIETVVPVLEETQPEVIPAEAAVEEPLPDWLETLASEEEVISAEVVEPETAPQEEIELPEWMKEPEEKEELPWQPGPIEAPAVPVPALDINQASLVELEALPGVGFRMAQSILNYRQDHGPFSSLEDLLQVPNFDRDLLQELGEQITVAKAEPLSPLVVEEELRAIDADQEILIRARNALMQEQIETMTEYYSRLIKQEHLLDEVIHDLHEALYRFPVEVGIWETLGDAYARCDQLQEALDAYTKAEELLR